MPITNATVRKAMAEADIVAPELLDAAEREADARGVALSDVLTERGFVSDARMGRFMADLWSLPYADLRNRAIDEAVARLLPMSMAARSGVLPFRRTIGGYDLAVSDPEDLDVLGAVRRRLKNAPLHLHYAPHSEIARAALLLHESVQETLRKATEAAPAALLDAPLDDVIESVFAHARRLEADEIRLEPLDRVANAAYRVDGVLHPVAQYPNELHARLSSRLKAMARLRVDDRSALQQGTLRSSVAGEPFEARIAAVPTFQGEKIVLRMPADSCRPHFDLDAAGFSSDDALRVRGALAEPSGLLVVAGPPGSGRTTTLYAALRAIDVSEAKVATVEHPVECDFVGAHQIAVDPDHGLTFARGVRAALQDEPDVLLVGELRDEDTVAAALRAVDEGCLVLSALRAGSVADALAQLAAMPVDRALLAASVKLVVAQRLVRRTCTACVHSVTLERDDARRMGAPEELLDKLFGRAARATAYAGSRCDRCLRTGYAGRIGLFETFEMTSTARTLLSRGADAEAFRREAARSGAPTLIDDGVRKILAGRTTLEELLRALRT